MEALAGVMRKPGLHWTTSVSLMHPLMLTDVVVAFDMFNIICPLDSEQYDHSPTS